MSNTGLECTVACAASGSGGAGLRPAGAAAGPRFVARRDPRLRITSLRKDEVRE
jgi:hypothetical protein